MDKEKLLESIIRIQDNYSIQIIERLKDVKIDSFVNTAYDKIQNGKSEILKYFSKLKKNFIEKLNNEDFTKEKFQEKLNHFTDFIQKVFLPHLDYIKDFVKNKQSPYSNKLKFKTIQTSIYMNIDFVKDNINKLNENIYSVFYEKYPEENILPGDNTVENKIQENPNDNLSNKPIISEKKTLLDLLSDEDQRDFTNDYDNDLNVFQTQLSKLSSKEITEDFRIIGIDKFLNMLGSLLSKIFGSGQTPYKKIIKEGYVYIIDFKKNIQDFEKAVKTLEYLMSKIYLSKIPVMEYELQNDKYSKIKKKVIIKKLFRNINTYISIVKNINQDLFYEIAFYLLYKPGAKYYRELKLIFDKTIGAYADKVLRLDVNYYEVQNTLKNIYESLNNLYSLIKQYI